MNINKRKLGILSAEQVVAQARQALVIEQKALEKIALGIDENFVQACELIMHTQGRVVVMGMGKSGHIGRKVAATLASTGTPALFVHPAEASHGDLGMITKKDIVLALSNSGESRELNIILPLLRRQGIVMIAVTGNARSTLAQCADIVLDASVEKEACPLNLAPTASTTAQLALGDALAVVLLEARGFKAEDFARSHPGGSLGRKLLTHVADLMRTGDALPIARLDTDLVDVMRQMSTKSIGACIIVDEQFCSQGIFTDGDLRRLIETGQDIRQLRAQAVMQAQPKTIASTALAVDAAAMMEQYRITSILVTKDGKGHSKLLGVIHISDLMQHKVI